MKKISSLFFILCMFCKIALDAEVYSPKMYQSLWPDFCLEHLQKHPQACSDVSKDGTQIDPNMISSNADLIPTKNSRCGFRICQKCHEAVRLTTFESSSESDDEDNEDEDSSYLVMGYKCHCVSDWCNESGGSLSGEETDEDVVIYEKDEDEEDNEDIAYNYWERCGKNSIPHAYFEIHTKQYSRFLKHHLLYSKENPTCLCYWPHRSKLACEISNTVYDKVYPLLSSSSLKKLTETEHNKADFPDLGDRSEHGVLSGLFFDTFFYSQYREVLLNLSEWKKTHGGKKTLSTLNALEGTLNALQPKFLKLYSQCLSQHPHPKIYYERGMILFHQGVTEDSLEDIRALINWASQHHREDLLTSELYLQEGTLYEELGLYDLAVQALTEAIHKDPSNFEAYFQRASSYFELGNFDLCLEDYLASGLKPQPIPQNATEMLSFSVGLTQGILQGSAQASSEFFPSILSSLRGLGNGLWAFVQDPVQISTDFVQAAQSCITFIKENTSKENLALLVPECQELLEKWKELGEEKRGEITGKLIGKYGVEIFSGVGITKAMKAFRNLKRANNVLTFEAMKLSTSNKTGIELTAAERALVRKQIEKVVPRSESTVYKAAVSQDKHVKMVRDYLDKPAKEIQKGINSYEKQIARHKDKISNPAKYCPDWDNFHPERREALVNKIWPTEIHTYSEQRNVLRSILNERLSYGE